MSPRKVVQTADAPDLPTIKDYFGMMAEEQAEDIRRLKQAAAGKNSAPPEKQKAGNPVADPWLMHPIRPAKGSAAKRGAARFAPRKASKKTAKKAAKKASKKTRR
jgi:hypothetical protein